MVPITLSFATQYYGSLMLRLSGQILHNFLVNNWSADLSSATRFVKLALFRDYWRHKSEFFKFRANLTPILKETEEISDKNFILKLL